MALCTLCICTLKFGIDVSLGIPIENFHTTIFIHFLTESWFCQIFIGFCDSAWSKTEVFKVIQSSVKVNVAYIDNDKVVIVCAGRIEGAHVGAIKQFMDWLSYKNDKYKKNFCFIYNKSDGLSEGEKMANLAHMLDKLEADSSAKIESLEMDGTVCTLNQNINLGFPSGASYRDVRECHETLLRATSGRSNTDFHRIPVNESSCTIL